MRQRSATDHGDYEHNERRYQTDWRHDDDDQDRVNGLVSRGYEEEIARWVINEVKEIPGAITEFRKARLLYGKGMKGTFAHVSEAHSLVRVSGMTDKLRLVQDLH